MNIQEKIDETKKRTQLMNGVTIDWQYAQQLLLEVFPVIRREALDPRTAEAEYNTLFNLFSNIENNIRGLKDMIPFNKEESKGTMIYHGEINQ
jgi:hypothetical protein